MRRVLWSAALVGIVLSAGFVRAGDQETSQQIADSLRSRLKNYSVGVKVEDGTVWLSGYVSNPKQMSLAVDTAQKTPGVERVVNYLTIGNAATAPATSNLHQPGNAASNVGVAQSDRQAPTQGMMEMPDFARQQLAGPFGSPENQSAAAGNSSNAARPAQDNGAAYQAGGQPNSGNYQQSPGYFPGAGPVNAAYYPGYQNANNPNAGYYAPPGAAGPNPGNSGRPTIQPVPLPMGAANPTQYHPAMQSAGPGGPGGEQIGAPQPVPSMQPMGPGPPAPYHFDHPQMPGYAWPSYAAYPNYAGVTYPKQYSPTAWPYIGPFYPYPQVPLGWRKVTLEWEDGWWQLDFKDSH